MDWLVWLGLICVVSGAALFIFGMRHDPMLAIAVPLGFGLIAGLLLFFIWSGNPSAAPARAAGESEPAEETPNPPLPNPLDTRKQEPIPNAVAGNAGNGRTTDLLQSPDLLRGQLNGRWELRNGALIAPMVNAFAPAKLTIPYRPPESFELLAEVQRLQGRESINFGFPIGGRDVMICIDGYGGLYSGINLIDRATADRNESRRRGPFLRDNQNHTIVCRVEGNSLKVTVDNRVAIDWTGDVNRLSLDRRWPHGPLGQIELGSWHSSYRISRLEVTPLP